MKTRIMKTTLQISAEDLKRGYLTEETIYIAITKIDESTKTIFFEPVGKGETHPVDSTLFLCRDNGIQHLLHLADNGYKVRALY